MIYYLLLGLIFAGIPTYLDVKKGIQYAAKDYLIATGIGLIWPVYLVLCWWIHACDIDLDA